MSYACSMYDEPDLIGRRTRCDPSECHKCGFNPIEAARRKYIIRKYGLTHNRLNLVGLDLWRYDDVRLPNLEAKR